LAISKSVPVIVNLKLTRESLFPWPSNIPDVESPVPVSKFLGIFPDVLVSRSDLIIYSDWHGKIKPFFLSALFNIEDILFEYSWLFYLIGIGNIISVSCFLAGCQV